MLTKLTIRNFKRFDDVDIELGHPVVFVGPNNSGKTSAMQALSLWDIGIKRWSESRSGMSESEQSTGVRIDNRDLLAIPHPRSNLLWRDLRVRKAIKDNGRQRNENVRIEIIVEGVDEIGEWSCGLEFDYANEGWLYCRPLRIGNGKAPERMPVPPQAAQMRIAFLPPMSGLTAVETRLDRGAINVRIGEGRTAEVLRNLCYRIMTDMPSEWENLIEKIDELFGARLDEPRYVVERGEITMDYCEAGKNILDLSSSGRGLQQTLLLFAYMIVNPGSVILLDEPDAHLESIRQREIYYRLTELAADSGSQIVAATHSEVLLNEAAGKDLAIAFVGKPHSMGGRESQVRKALATIGFDQYYLAELTGWVLYLEGPTDLAILRTFAKRLGHAGAVSALEKPFVHYVGNQPTKAEDHHFGLREAVPGLKGLAVYDRLNQDLEGRQKRSLEHYSWKRREIENYFCTPATLENYVRASAAAEAPGSLFVTGETPKRLRAMGEAISEITAAWEKLHRGSPWDDGVKSSDDFLTPLFKEYFKKLGQPNLMGKKSFYELAEHVPENEIDPEVGEVLDMIARVAVPATPRT